MFFTPRVLTKRVATSALKAIVSGAAIDLCFGVFVVSMGDNRLRAPRYAGGRKNKCLSERGYKEEDLTACSASPTMRRVEQQVPRERKNGSTGSKWGCSGKGSETP